MEEAFENAALATFEVITETKCIDPIFKETIEVSGFDKKALLYNWLEALLVKFELQGILYSKFKIHRIEKTKSEFKLQSLICGEKFNPDKHPQKVGVKAVTYHCMDIQEAPDRTILRFILDI